MGASLEVEGRPLGVAVEVARTPAARRRGLLGRDGVDGLLVLRPCRQVHTMGMRFPVDVGFVDRRGRVLRVVTMAPARVSRPTLRGRWVVEGPAGAFAEWGIVAGAHLLVREHAARDS